MWLVDKPARNDLHPTMKPVALVACAIRNPSKSRDPRVRAGRGPRPGVVLDPFAGSGSTLIACEKTGRQARLIDLDPRYCDVIIRRWQNGTGTAPGLDGDGRTFEETAAERAAAAS